MFSILIVICNSIHVKAFDHVNISKLFKNLFFCNLFVCFIFYIYLQKYENVEVFQLRQLERLFMKTRKAELDIKFLRNCKIFNVIPKFLSFNLPYTNEFD